MRNKNCLGCKTEENLVFIEIAGLAVYEDIIVATDDVPDTQVMTFCQKCLDELRACPAKLRFQRVTR